jgi:hypothetical protein
MHYVNDGTHKDAMWILARLKTIKAVVKFVDREFLSVIV